MSSNRMELVAALEARLGHAFVDKSAALTALTHSSWLNEHQAEGGEDNERLEFLGDAVIDLAVSQRLMATLPQAREGVLSKIRAALVNADALAVAELELGLGELLRLGKGEEMTGGRRKTSLLSNCFEAVVGAVFLEAGLGPIQRLVDEHLLPQVDTNRLDVPGGRDFKTTLQERAQILLRTTPTYRVIGERGPEHEKLFEVEMLIGDKVMGRGTGRSKKEAEQSAAQAGLERLDEEGSEAKGTFDPGESSPASSAEKSEKS